MSPERDVPAGTGSGVAASRRRSLQRERGSRAGTPGGTALSGLVPSRGHDRAVSAVVGKTLEAGLVVLFISTIVTVLYGGVVPEYRAAAGEELGERVLAEATVEVHAAVPADPRSEATVRTSLPSTIEGTTYRIEARNESLALVHDHPAVGGEVPVSLPGDVQRIEGEWHSADQLVVRVERTSAGRVVRLEGAST